MRIPRNEVCPFCDSGLKYKKCHANSELFISEQIATYGIYNKAKKKGEIKHCIHPQAGNSCNGNAIGAHTISRARILEELADAINEQQQVKMLNLRFEKGTNVKPCFSMEDIPITKATTFTGFCSNHDKIFIEPLDKANYELGNSKQEFYYAYRAFAFDYHKLLESIQNNRFYGARDFRLKELSFDLIQSLQKGETNFLHYKSIFDEGLLNEEFNDINTIAYEIKQKAYFATSAAFFIQHDIYGEKFCNDDTFILLIINIFPQGDKTYVLLSTFCKDHKYLNNFKQQLTELSEREQVTFINNFVPLYCHRNLVISPSFWDGLAIESKKDFMWSLGVSPAQSFNKNLLIEPTYSLFPI